MAASAVAAQAAMEAVAAAAAMAATVAINLTRITKQDKCFGGKRLQQPPTLIAATRRMLKFLNISRGCFVHISVPLIIFLHVVKW